MTLVESNCSQTRFPTKNSLYEQLSIMKCHVKQLEKYGKEYAQEHLQEMEKLIALKIFIIIFLKNCISHELNAKF